MRVTSVAVALSVVAAWIAPAVTADAHGLIGKRFFPATLATEDPFVADELSLPTISHTKRPADGERPATRETEISAEFAKRLSPSFGISLGGAFRLLDPEGGKAVTGFDNLEVALKYVFFKSEAHEALASIGVSWDVGGTGSRRIDAERFDVITPSVLFGKGFGDLPDAIEFARPLALTGTFGVAIPTRRISKRLVAGEEEGSLEVEREVNPAVAQWGFAVQYNLQYLQSYVRDVALPAPLNRLIPIVEVVMQTPLDAPRGNGRVAGTVNPGLIWFGRYVQLGIEAVVPINARSGKNVGVLGQVHFYLDDLAPKIFSWTPLHGVLGSSSPR
jgi:hypothetical protein